MGTCAAPVRDSRPPYDDTKGIPGKTYYYRVIPCNSGGCGSAYPDAGTRKLVAPAKPAKPTSVTDAYSDKIRIKWNWINGVTSYAIYRCSGLSTRTCRAQNEENSASFYDDKNVTAGVITRYRIKACNYGKCSPYSDLVRSRRKLLPPSISTSSGNDTFVGLGVSDHLPDRINIHWNNIVGAKFYNIYRCANDLTSSCVLLKENNTRNFYSDIPPEIDVYHKYRIKACNVSGCSVFSRAQSGVMRYPNPSPPTISRIDSAKDKVTIFWSPVSIVGGHTNSTIFKIARCNRTIQNCPEFLVNSSPYVDRTGELGVRYSYFIRGCGSNHCRPYVSRSYGGKLLDIPSKPTASDDTFTDKIRINWNSINGADSYEVHRCTNSLASSCVRVRLVQTLTYDDTEAVPGTQYNYRITACKTTSQVDCSDKSAADPGKRKFSLQKITSTVALNVNHIHPDIVALVPMCRVFSNSVTSNANEIGLDRVEVPISGNRAVTGNKSVSITTNLHPGKKLEDAVTYTCTLYLKKATGLFVYSTNAPDISTRSTSTPVNSYRGTINVSAAKFEWRNGGSMHLDIGASTRLTATGVTP